MISRNPSVIGVLAAIALAMITTTLASGAQAQLPNWIKLREGEAAYFGVGSGTAAAACPTFDRYVEWLKTEKARKSELCPTMRGGQRVTVLGWRNCTVGANFVELIVHVRFAHGEGSAWTLGANPVVPTGVPVAVMGSACEAEAARVHARLSSVGAWLSSCRAVVVRQLVSSAQDTLVVRFLRSGVTVRIQAGVAVLPSPLYPNGYPRYALERFAE